MSILVTGGAGYIGTHTLVELINSGYDVVVFDNFSNSKPSAIENVKKITGKDFPFYRADMLSITEINKIFEENDIDSVIHFAGFKAVGESVAKPLEYYRNNIVGTLNILDVMRAHNVKKLIFSSSATVYGVPKTVPITEDFPLSVTNPYGATKLMIEDILRDLYKSDNEWSIILLRYFNPVGAHSSGLIFENPNGIPNNLMPRIIDAAKGKTGFLTVFGDDYDTYDGTGVRDYIHVVDLARGHVAAVSYLEKGHYVESINLGTGNGYSVLDMIKTFSRVNNVAVPYKIVERRPGDVAECYADPSKAEKLLGWKAEYNLEDMCRDAYRGAGK